jgi:type II secretory pathway pseudopilin PulG
MIELLVVMVLTGVLGSLLLGSTLGARQVTDDARVSSELTADVRRAMERLARELRQAVAIDRVDLPATPADGTAITFWADFDNDAARDVDASDPEVLTYRYVPAAGRLTLTVDDADGTAVTTPILAENVTAFGLSLRSSQWQYDRNADGVVDWKELDVSPIGNGDGRPDGAELSRIDSVVLDVVVRRDGRNQSYRTQVDLRNRHLI